MQPIMQYDNSLIIIIIYTKVRDIAYEKLLLYAVNTVRVIRRKKFLDKL
jgi:hypothetical protein